MDTVSLELRKLGKEYPGTVALQDFSAVFHGGKVYALLGKNGSGKSTLVKCISGAVIPTTGQLLLNDQLLDFKSPSDASDAGIAIVYQELSLILDFSIAENILIGRYHRQGIGKTMIDWPATNQAAAAILERLGIDLPVTEKVSRLSVGQRQMVEIAKAMSFNPKVLILDEPTSALARHETESLMKVVRQSRDQGVAIIFITHKLNEIHGVADYVTVLRDSHFIGTIPIEEAKPKVIVDMMFGDTELQVRPGDLTVGSEIVLSVNGLCRGNRFRDVSFDLHKGEILGIAGMLGAGRSELLRSIFGADPLESGQITLNGKSLNHPSIPEMKALGLAMTPENRKEEGLVQILSIRDNMCYASLDAIGRHGLIRERDQEAVVKRWTDELHIKLSNSKHLVSSLSGGNQQKVVVGNWLNTNPSVVFFDEPSRGIDVQAKQQIFQIMWDLSRRGLSVIFVSSELEELLEVCHRILIMEGGRITGETTPEKSSIDELYSLCMEA